ncbi:MAG TPA: serine hydrolase [Thermoanaerobaculia bacterium]|nr:serine hydrolase [Thermoanaerobaculia bacterium]
MRWKLILALTLVVTPLCADYREFQQIAADPSLSTKLGHAADKSLAQFPKLKADDLAMTIVDMTKESTISRGDYHGDAPFYPASVIKIFFMADTFLKNKFDVPDVPRAMREMIGVSDNDATGYIVDILADTEPGPDLEGRALDRFIAKRRSINDDFTRMAYDISAMCKPWSFGPYGRDRQVVGPKRENRNRLTTNTTTALITWIARGHAPQSELMLNYLARPIWPTRPDENQVSEFIGAALPAGTKLWSKAGWTSEVRHDTAYFETADGRKYVLTIFTRGLADDTKLVPAITRSVLTELGITPAPEPPASATPSPK